MHFGVRQDSAIFLDYMEEFYSETFFPYLEENDINVILQLGDVFDRRKYISFYTLKRAKEMFFDVCWNRSTDVVIILGNHDVYYKDTLKINSPTLLLEEYDNVTVVDRPQTNSLLGESYCMIPWLCRDNTEACLEEMKNTDAKMCIGHFEINGFSMYKGHQSEIGLSVDTFKKFDLTISGHFHHRSKNNNIQYIGTPYQLTWMDYGDDKGFHVLDTTNNQLSFIKNRNHMFNHMVYDDKKYSKKEISTKDYRHVKNSYVKVLVVNKTNAHLFETFLDKLYQHSPIEIQIIEETKELVEEIGYDMDNADDTLTTLNKFVDLNSENGIDNGKLKRIFRDLYTQALNMDKL